MQIPIMLEDGAIMPTRAHEDDAGLDLHSPIDVTIWPGNTVTIDTKVHAMIPKGYRGDVRSRSSLVDVGVITDGTIDAGYTGSIHVTLCNTSQQYYRIKRGERIAQLIVSEIETPELIVVESFPDTDRGSGGFGSTGR